MPTTSAIRRGVYPPCVTLTPSRAQVSALTPDARSEAAISEAVAACDCVGAAAIILSRALAGEDTAATTIATILPGLRDEGLGVALLGLGSGDRAAAWLAAVQSGAFPQLSTIGDIEAITLYVAWKLGADRAGLVKEARRLTRYALGFGGMVLLETIVGALDDANLSTAARHLRGYGELPEGKQVLRDFERARKRSVAEYVATLPATTPSQAPPGVTVRVGPRAGRNDPCPCGSGQKYKRCCADKDAQLAPSPISGMSWEDYITKGAARMTQDGVLDLPMRDLARVDLAQLELVPLVTAMRRFAAERLWSRATAAVDEIGRRPPEYDGFEDDHRSDVIYTALDARQLEVAAEQVAKLHGAAYADPFRLELALARRTPEALDLLAQTIEVAVRAEKTTDLIDLAHAVLRTVPALGIVLARACLHTGHPLDNETLLESIEDARDELGLPAGDPAWEDFETSEPDEDEDDDEDRATATAEALALRSSLRETAGRVEELERQLKSHQDRLAAKPERVVEAPDREAERRLRMKIEELQGLVREGNAERGDLRRQLIAVNTGARGPETAEPMREDDEGEDIEAGERQVAIPSLGRRFLDALDGVPQAVAAEAMRTIGALAAGDHAAWRGVKAAKDMSRQVLMRRIGIHHRLLFRAEAGAIEVMDLITRENLLTTLKRLR